MIAIRGGRFRRRGRRRLALLEDAGRFLDRFGVVARDAGGHALEDALFHLPRVLEMGHGILEPADTFFQRFRPCQRRGARGNRPIRRIRLATAQAALKHRCSVASASGKDGITQRKARQARGRP